MLLPRSFYLGPDVVSLAADLLGKFLVTRDEQGVITSGMICETEAYAGVTDRASHAFGGRRSGRTEIMYRVGGTAYVYHCYGMHSLFNVVTNREGIPHAILIRGIRPIEGIETMLRRAGKPSVTKEFGTGPGRVSKILGIHYSHTGTDLTKKPAPGHGFGIWIEDRGVTPDRATLISGPRIGVDYAGEDALLPYRFRIGNPSGF